MLARSHSVEVAFLMGATAYGLTLPLKRTISLIDAVVLVTILRATTWRLCMPYSVARCATWKVL